MKTNYPTITVTAKLTRQKILPGIGNCCVKTIKKSNGCSYSFRCFDGFLFLLGRPRIGLVFLAPDMYELGFCLTFTSSHCHLFA
jgi:hypothetical protein